MDAPCPAASRPSRCTAMTASRSATPRRRPGEIWNGDAYRDSASAPERQAAQGLRELRPALEPVRRDSGMAEACAHLRAPAPRDEHRIPSAPVERPGHERRQAFALVIPTLNEEEAIGPLLARVPRRLVDEVIVADGGSRDRTAERARGAGREGDRCRARLWPRLPGGRAGGRRRLRHRRLHGWRRRATSPS